MVLGMGVGREKGRIGCQVLCLHDGPTEGFLIIMVLGYWL